MDNLKPTLSVVSFSGGKDSTAMLLKMLELGMQVDVVLFCDTGLEFEQLYSQIQLQGFLCTCIAILARAMIRN